MALTQILKLASYGCAFLLSCYLLYLSRLCGFLISMHWWVFSLCYFEKFRIDSDIPMLVCHAALHETGQEQL